MNGARTKINNKINNFIYTEGIEELITKSTLKNGIKKVEYTKSD